MGDPGAELLKLVSRFILLLGLAVRFKPYWIGGENLELDFGVWIFFSLFFYLSFLRGHR